MTLGSTNFAELPRLARIIHGRIIVVEALTDSGGVHFLRGAVASGEDYGRVVVQRWLDFLCLSRVS